MSMTMVPSRNGRTAVILLGLSLGMVGMAYAAVPLYDLFCRVTGYGGTTQIAQSENVAVLERVMKIRFSANTHRDMSWQFKPAQIAQTLKIGEQGLAFYEAHNPTNQIITGTASYNVTPHKAGLYFIKIECFCFTEQTLLPGETVLMPVTYFIDPEIVEDVGLDDVSEVVLSYTFFVLDEDAIETGTGVAD